MLMNGKIHQPNTINVGVESDFYRLNHLTDLDRVLLRGLIQMSPEQARPMLTGFLHIFDGWYELLDSVSPALRKSREIREKLEEYIITAEELYHGRIEDGVLPILAKLRGGDATALDDEDAVMDFCYFVALQWLRTKTMRKAVLGRTQSRPGLDASRIWPIAAHITAANFGWTLFSLRKQNALCLIENQTAIPLITGDQPVVNLQTTPKGDDSPEYLSLYYPISPQHAIFVDDYRHPLNFGDAFTSTELVQRLNRQMVATADMQVYASTRECLIPFAPRLRR